MTDIEALVEARKKDPFDTMLLRVFADAMDIERNKPQAAAYWRRYADTLDNPLNKDLEERIIKGFRKATDNYRSRLLSLNECIDCCRWAFNESDMPQPIKPYEYVDGGGVPNSYGYTAGTSLFLAVVRLDGKICVDGGRAVARKGGGRPSNIWGELGQWREGSVLLRELLYEWASTR